MEDYLYNNCPQNINYILYTDFENIFRSNNIEIDFVSDDINYIYFFYIKSYNDLITCFRVGTIIYLLVLTNNSTNNKLNKLNDLSEIRKYLSNSQMKLIGIRKDKFFSLSMNNINDKINIVSNKLNLTRKYNIKNLDLELFSEEDILNVHELTLNSNFHLKNLSFIQKFENLKLLNIWNLHTFTYEEMENICKKCFNLEIINIHNCPNINIRILLPMYKLNNLKKILIDDKKLWCQYEMHKPFILDKEWRNLHNESITDIVINSEQLNLDIIDYIIKSSNNLNTFILSDHIYKILIKNVLVGSSTNRYLSFITWESAFSNKVQGTKIPWKPTFTNMIKNISLIKNNF